MEYIFNEHVGFINIKSSIRYFELSIADSNQIDQLSKMYCTLFNLDNKKLLKLLGIAGRTTREGLWSEEPYTYKKCTEIINDYVTGDYFGVTALGSTENKEYVLGAAVYQIRDLANLKEKGYFIPFNVPEDIEVWCEIDNFRRDLTLENEEVKYLSNKMRSQVLKMYKDGKQVLIYSSTNNPIMMKSWQKDGFTIVNKPTTFGNIYQAFKMV